MSIKFEQFKATKGLEPVSQQLAKYFRKAIETRKYRPNEKLPTTQQIVDQFNVSTHTVRDAMSILASEGLINMTPRKGTFVNFKYPFNQEGGKTQKKSSKSKSTYISGALIGVYGLISHDSALGDWDCFRVDSARGSMVECDRHGLTVISLPVHKNFTDEQYVELAKQYNCNGVLWCNEDFKPLAAFSRAEIPAVLMCRNQPAKLPYSTVCLDYYKAGCEVAEIIRGIQPEKPSVAFVHLEYPNHSQGAYANHFLSGLQSFADNSPSVKIDVQTWSIFQLKELLEWLVSLPQTTPVIFVCSYHLLGLITHYREETQKVFEKREVFAISNREPNLQLLSCATSFDPYIIYDDFTKLSSIGIQKLVTIMSGLLDNTATTVQMPIKRLSQLGIGVVESSWHQMKCNSNYNSRLASK